MSPSPTGPPRVAAGVWRHRGFWIVIALYVLVNAGLWVATEPDLRLQYAGDGTSWYSPAVGLYQHGAFVLADTPGEPSVYRPPLFSLFGAAMFGLFGGPSPNAIAVGQIVLLLLTALLFRDSVEDWLPGWGVLAMALMLFNPNVLTIAQYTQSDTLFLFFLTLSLWATLRFARGETAWRYPLSAGVALALASLTRPTAQFLILALPLAFPLIATAGGRSHLVWRGLLQGCLASLLAVALIAPWIAYVNRVDGHYGLSDTHSRYRYVWDQATIVEAQSSGVSYHQASRTLEVDPDGPRARFIAEFGPGWNDLAESGRYAYLLDRGYGLLLSYPAADLAIAYTRSIAQFLLGGGAGRWHYLLDTDPERLAEIWFETSQTDLGGMVRKYLEVPPLALAASAVCFGFVFLARVFGLIGMVAMINRKDWPLLLTLVAVIAYFALVHLFVGNSRYRMVTEPALMMLFLYGLATVWRRWRERRATQGR